MPISDLNELLGSMSPRLNEGVYVFASVSKETDTASLDPIATFRENEGISLVVDESHLDGTEVDVSFRAAWITLEVNSDLNAIGLTAAVASALAKSEISCNVVAGANHDHLFVPLERAQDAMDALNELQEKHSDFGHPGQ